MFYNFQCCAWYDDPGVMLVMGTECEVAVENELS